LDRYEKKYYQRIVDHAIDSWRNTEGSLLASSVETVAILHPNDTSSLHLFEKFQSLPAPNSPDGTNKSVYSATSSLGHSRTQGSLRYPASNPLSASASMSILSSSMTLSPTQSLAGTTRRATSPAHSTNPSHQSLSSTGRMPPKIPMKIKSLTVLDNIHSLITKKEDFKQDVYGGADDRSVSTRDSNSSSRGGDSLFSGSQSLNNRTSSRKSSRKGRRGGDAGGSGRLQPLSGNASLITEISGMGSGLDPEKATAFLDNLAEDGIYLGENGIPLQNQSFGFSK
jgi:hypothetical protein